MDTIETRVEQLEDRMNNHAHESIDGTSILSNFPKVQYVTTDTTVTPKGITECLSITALASAITINNPNTAGYNFQKLIIRIKDNGTARAITWGSAYVAGGFALPSTTILGKITTLGFFFNSDNSLNSWQLVGYAQEA